MGAVQACVELASLHRESSKAIHQAGFFGCFCFVLFLADHFFVGGSRDPSDDWEESGSEEEGLEGAANTGAKVKPKKGVKVDIDLGLSAYANATRFEQLLYSPV